MVENGLIENFKFSKFQITIKAKDTLALPRYKGSTFRGGFGNSFKKVVCINRGNICDECMLKEKCVYAYIFETPVPENSDIMRKYRYCPHPFIIEPPKNTKTAFKSGEELAFGLVLIGKAIDYLPYFIYTFEELGKIGIGKGRGKYELVKVTSRGSGTESEGNSIYSGDKKVLKSNFKTLTLDDIQSPANSAGISLNFTTPTRIVYDTQLTLDLEFHILIRALLRRISLLSYFHCGTDISDLDFKGIIEKSKNIETSNSSLKWYDWERYSARQDTRMKLGGFKGEVTFEGEMKDFMPFILLGEQAHVGKGTSFGLGEYEIT